MPWLPDSSLHPRQTRRVAIQAGAVGLLGLGMNHIAGLHALYREKVFAMARNVGVPKIDGRIGSRENGER